MVELKPITEDNFIDAFNLKLAPEQERGYGSAALDRVLDYIRTKPFGASDRVALTGNKENPVARKLYENKGFQATDVEDEDEIELVLTIF